MATHGDDGGGRTAVRAGAAALHLATPTRQLADAPLAVRVSGIPIDADVVIRLRARWWDGEELVATARYRSLDGTIDVARDAPVEGYAGVEADGLVQALVPVADAGGTHRPSWRRSRAGGPSPTGLAADLFEVSARVDASLGADIAATIHREACAASVLTLPVALPGSTGTLFHDPKRAPHAPAIIAVPLLQRPAAARAAALLASHGYPVLLLGALAPGHHLATVPIPVLHAAEAVLTGIAAPTVPASSVLGLDLSPDRRSRQATRAWSALLERLRDLRVAPSPQR